MSLMEKTLREATVEYEVRLRMGYDDWREQIDESKQTEWVDGEVIIFMPPAIRHQGIVTFLVKLLGLFVDHNQLGRVLVSPVEMRAQPWGNAREPDILFVAGENLDRFDNLRLAGPADLVIEVISPESVQRDSTDKFHEYQEAGISEYWLLDGRENHKRAQFFVLDQSGKYQEADTRDGLFHSTVLVDFWLRAEWLWPESQPNTLLAFAEIVGLPAEVVKLLKK